MVAIAWWDVILGRHATVTHLRARWPDLGRGKSSMRALPAASMHCMQLIATVLRYVFGSDKEMDEHDDDDMVHDVSVCASSSSG